MLTLFKEFVQSTSDLLWGMPLILLLVGTGVWLTINLRGLQFTKLWHSLYLALVKDAKKAMNLEILLISRP